jgi:thiamine biosynthesis lipoprotein
VSRTNDTAVFGHPAMNTVFHVRFAEPPPGAAALAGACFAEVERLEGLLSRYRPDSDISRLNALDGGESLLVEESTHEVLLRAMALHVATGGLFDVTLGAGAVPDGCWSVAPDRPLVTRVRPGRQLDLGGIGKGFALDGMARFLADHGLFAVLLSAGASTHLACGARAWPIGLGDLDPMLELCNAALSASGSTLQGAHVLGPDGVPPKCYPHRRVWVAADDAGTADAWSTACLLAEGTEIAPLVGADPTVRAVWGEGEDGTVRLLAGSRPGE